MRTYLFKSNSQHSQITSWLALFDISISNIDIDIDIDNGILENIDIEIDIDKEISENIDIDKISNRLEFGISNRATPTFAKFAKNQKIFKKYIKNKKNIGSTKHKSKYMYQGVVF